MGKSVIFDITKESVSDIAGQIAEKDKDSILVLAPLSGNVSVHAPAKKGKNKGYHRLKLEVWIPEDAIKGENALDDFGAVTLLRLPKKRIEDHLIRNPREEELI
ncbi:hypothetical protein [Bacillus mesophilum]|uniref:Uncharacterized protein n=1 Tax=Bacillus mesophilum TaxID=1071718 RepID=A0A7V7RPX7_9BACI|nr:hypothetical protein [Bacillus mesophilum]KAB2334282.1 hypothetical protein F7732_09435 [Bacillus mesophilum]